VTMRRFSGWSLKELLIVIGLVVALVMVLLPIGLHIRTEARRAECRTRMQTLGNWLIQEYSRTGSLPITWEEYQAFAKKAGVEPRCPLNGEYYEYYLIFNPPYREDGSRLPDTPQLRREWTEFIVGLLKRHRYHPMLQCETCYAPQLKSKIVRWEWSGADWYPIFSDEVDPRFLGINFYGCLGYYDNALLGMIITADWTCRSGYNPFAEWGGVPPTRTTINRREQSVRQGGDCW